MLSFLPPIIRGPLAFFIWTIYTVVACLFIYIFTFLKFILPFPPMRRLLTFALKDVVEIWIALNSALIRLTQNIHWELDIPPDLDYKASYLVLANHQAWLDITVLQSVLNYKIPLLKFFLKKELFWVPFLGIAWWALDFPFMQRSSSNT